MDSIKRLESSTKLLDRILEITAMSLLVLSTVLAISNVVTRVYFDTTYPIVDEICRYSIIYGSFLYLGPLIKKDEHIKMDFLNNILKGRLLQVNNLIINVILFVSCVILFWTGTQWVLSSFQLGLKTTSGTMLMAIPSLAVPIGMFFGCIYSFLLIVMDYKKIRLSVGESLSSLDVEEVKAHL
ncbi:TRAP transporter small permease [Psychrobacillus sp. OK032]|uniref:TRAP transporter small permease n=1 Tax=Psychrobacillus sp. OK032 TaxID=1884358 RepID=UPI0008C37ED0|nr:TRAP transporter small permease subunit [Psychrobacillus sp. OK032]SER82332.1 TRAP-type C4-dicarboxylate transport system, small permease component [Psychrobacillus sp. OK032]